jgi:hypothetical protein
MHVSSVVTIYIFLAASWLMKMLEVVTLHPLSEVIGRGASYREVTIMAFSAQ